MERKSWKLLDKALLVGSNPCQGKNDIRNGFILYELFLAPKIKYCLTRNQYGVIVEHKTLKRLNDSNRLLDQCQYFKMIDCKKYLLSCQGLGKNRLIIELSYQQK